MSEMIINPLPNQKTNNGTVIYIRGNSLSDGIIPVAIGRDFLYDGNITPLCEEEIKGLEPFFQIDQDWITEASYDVDIDDPEIPQEKFLKFFDKQSEQD